MQKRIISLLLCIALVFTLGINTFALEEFGYAHIQRKSVIGEGTSLIQNNFYNGSRKQSEKYVTYTPNTMVYPIMYYGNRLYGRSTIETVTSNLEKEGYRVHAGVNADFFSYSTGLPLGMLINDGIIDSSCTTENAVAFYEDGTAYIGTPSFSASMAIGENTYKIDHVNKLRQPYGIYLLTERFSASTRTTTPGYDVVIRPAENSMFSLGNTVIATVEDVFPSESAVAIPEGCWILTVDNNAEQSYKDILTSLVVGDVIEITATVSDESFMTARYAVGGGDIIIKDGNIIQSHDTANAPRTALGIKADGTIILYTLDGRQASFSVGASVTTVAKRLLELGCVNAINLDGGGSTALSVSYAGAEKSTLINSPSDGKPRPCANYILLVSSEKGSGQAKGIAINTDYPTVLKGTKVTLSAVGYDETYAPAEIGDVTFSSEGGTIDDNIFIPTATGNVVISAESGNLTGETTVAVVEAPYSVGISVNGTKADTLTIEPGQSADITGVAEGGINSYHYDQGIFTFSENVVDGVYTAPDAEGTDVITVTCGQLTASLPVTVSYAADPIIMLTADEVSAKLDVAGTYTSAKLYIDGKETSLIGDNGIYTASYSLTDGMHRISADVGAQRGYTLHVSQNVTVGDTVSVFTDTAGHWCDVFATYLCQMGVANGELMADNTRNFYPDNSITRQEFAKMMVSYLGVDTSLYSNTVLPYSDTDLMAEWALPYIKAAYSLGIMTGSVALDGTTVFNPTSVVTRAEVITIIGRTIDTNYKNGLTEFADISDLPSWASPYLATLTGLSVISGYDDGTLKPNRSITRGEAAKMLTCLY